MWYSKYQLIDFNGLEPTVRVQISYYNDVDYVNYVEALQLSPENLDSQGFKDYVQSRVDLLNDKQASLDASPVKPSEIHDKPIGDVPIKPLPPAPTNDLFEPPV